MKTISKKNHKISRKKILKIGFFFEKILNKKIETIFYLFYYFFFTFQASYSMADLCDLQVLYELSVELIRNTVLKLKFLDNKKVSISFQSDFKATCNWPKMVKAGKRSKQILPHLTMNGIVTPAILIKSDSEPKNVAGASLAPMVPKKELKLK